MPGWGCCRQPGGGSSAPMWRHKGLTSRSSQLSEKWFKQMKQRVFSLLIHLFVSVSAKRLILPPSWTTSESFQSSEWETVSVAAISVTPKKVVCPWCSWGSTTRRKKSSLELECFWDVFAFESHENSELPTNSDYTPIKKEPTKPRKTVNMFKQCFIASLMMSLVTLWRWIDKKCGLNFFRFLHTCLSFIPLIL